MQCRADYFSRFDLDRTPEADSQTDSTYKASGLNTYMLCGDGGNPAVVRRDEEGSGGEA